MELILAIAAAGPIGYLARTHQARLLIYLTAWAVVLPIQTIVVHSENADDINWQYALVNVAILAIGLGLNRLGAELRYRRRRPAVVAGGDPS